MDASAHGRHIVKLASALLLLGAVSCHEVEDQLPLAVALDYVQRHPEYFIRDPSDATLDVEPPTGRDALIDRELAGDWVARSTLAHADDESELGWAWQSIANIQATLLSQREPGVRLWSNDCVCDEDFEEGAFARLVRGYGNCDTLNYALAMLLHVHEDGTQMHHLDYIDEDGDQRGHTLTVLPGDDGWVFADAWAGFGLMVLEHEVAPDVPTHAELAATTGANFDVMSGGVLPRATYETSGPQRPLALFYGLRGDGPDLTIPELPPVRDARDAYLRARVFALYGLHDHARPLYQQAADMTCHDAEAPLCQLASAFLRRAQPREPGHWQRLIQG